MVEKRDGPLRTVHIKKKFHFEWYSVFYLEIKLEQLSRSSEPYPRQTESRKFRHARSCSWHVSVTCVLGTFTQQTKPLHEKRPNMSASISILFNPSFWVQFYLSV